MKLCIRNYVLIMLLMLFALVKSLNYNVYNYAGTAGSSTSTGTGGKATSASLNQPRSIWQDSLSNSYVVEGGASCVRKIAVSTSILSVYAGICGTTGATGNGGKATSATMQFPVSMMMDSNSKMYVCEYSNNLVRSVVASTTILSTFAGTGTGSSTGTGPATSATVSGPHGVWANSNGEVYISEYNGKYVRFVSTSNIISFVVGKVVLV